MKNKLIITIFILFTITITTITILDNKQDREANYIQNNIIAYQIADDEDILITLKNGEGYYFNIYKDTYTFRLFNKNNDTYLYLNNNLSIKLDPEDVQKIDITKCNYKNYKSSFIALKGAEIWELANEEEGIINEIQSYIHFILYNQYYQKI